MGYYSAVSKDFKASDLEEIIRISGQNNQALAVTGMLMYADGCFFQIIEGPDKKLEALYSNISSDHRHVGMLKFIDEEIEQRNFPEWSMGGLRIDPALLEHEEVFGLTRMALANKLPDTASETVKVFMKSFYNSATQGMG